MKTIIVKLNNESVSFNHSEGVPIASTNIPWNHLRFKTSKAIYWKVEMISFHKKEKRLKVKVVDYQYSSSGNFEKQEAKYPINFVEFEPLHWSELEGLLTTYQKKYLRDIITEETFHRPNLKTFRIPSKIPLSKLKFDLGFVSFTKTFRWNKAGDSFQIPMPDSIPEYDYIKAYFSKILSKSTVDVIFEVESSNAITRVVEIRSADLQKINHESIQILKIQKLDQWTSKKPKFAPPDQEIFTFEEAMKSYGDDALANIDIIEKDLLFHLLEKEDVRNRIQLQYLSARIHQDDEKLLMTLVPHFGFIFIHKGEEMTHFIWELLNSHATYVWSLPNGKRNEMIRKIEQEISTINQQGRTQYKTHFRSNANLFFNALTHRSSSYSYEQYFSRWKKNLDNLLV